MAIQLLCSFQNCQNLLRLHNNHSTRKAWTRRSQMRRALQVRTQCQFPLGCRSHKETCIISGKWIKYLIRDTLLRKRVSRFFYLTCKKVAAFSATISRRFFLRVLTLLFAQWQVSRLSISGNTNFQCSECATSKVLISKPTKIAISFPIFFRKQDSFPCAIRSPVFFHDSYFQLFCRSVLGFPARLGCQAPASPKVLHFCLRSDALFSPETYIFFSFHALVLTYEGIARVSFVFFHCGR